MNVIYLSAGSGVRAKLGYPKQFALLGGKPIMMYGLEILQSMPNIDRIIVTCAESEINKTNTLIDDYGITKAVLVLGGATRQESVRLGLSLVDSKHLLVMEAVRPFVNKDFINKVIQTKGDFITPIKHAISTVLTFDGAWLDRRMTGEVQMPQKYGTKLLLDAHVRACKEYTDDAALVIDTLHIEPCIIEGLEENIKITTPLDLRIAEPIYQYIYNGHEE